MIVEYSLYNYDEYGNLFSKSKKYEFPDETSISYFVSDGGEMLHISNDEIIERDPIGIIGKFVYDYRNIAATGTETGVYFNLLGEEYLEKDAEYKEGQYHEVSAKE